VLDPRPLVVVLVVVLAAGAVATGRPTAGRPPAGGRGAGGGSLEGGEGRAHRVGSSGVGQQILSHVQNGSHGADQFLAGGLQLIEGEGWTFR